MSISRPPLTWQPDQAKAAESAIGRFAKSQGFSIDEYDALWRWSVSEPAAFWEEVWKFTGLRGTLGLARSTSNTSMFGTRFFNEGRLNVADNLLSGPSTGIAVIEADIHGVNRKWTFGELRREVESVASWMRKRGIGPGHVVATVAPNRFEALVSFLACSAVGGIWTSCAPELSSEAILDRIGQVQPKMLFVSQSYNYNGKSFKFQETIDRLLTGIPDLTDVVIIDRDQSAKASSTPNSTEIYTHYNDLIAEKEPFEWRQFSFNSPGLILYTSGTTGKPKAIVHSGGGVLLKLASEHTFHSGLDVGDVLFWYTNTAWMMFHWLAFALVRGCAIVLYDDAPVPTAESGLDYGILWRIAEEAGVTAMGISPSYITLLQDADYSPSQRHILTKLHTVFASGSPVSAEQFHWVHNNVSSSALFCPISGGTELMSAFFGGSRLHKVRAGEMSCRTLGMAVDIFDERGVSVVGRKGELVCTQPFPSMPLTFWGENGDARYHAAYFETFPKVWAHGDLAEQTLSGGFIIYGRSDATLNPGGVRIGTAEIYRPLRAISAVEAAVVFGRPVKNSEEIVLCVKLAAGLRLDQKLAADIRAAVRSKASPRHVPHAIYQVDDLPLTQNGKIVEAAARAAALSMDTGKFSLQNPASLEHFSKINQLQPL